MTLGINIPQVTDTQTPIADPAIGGRAIHRIPAAMDKAGLLRATLSTLFNPALSPQGLQFLVLRRKISPH
ncbi:MAG: hypothetical protein ACJA2M_001953 [Polaribacter sp.]|jgi:hypothetical protein